MKATILGLVAWLPLTAAAQGITITPTAGLYAPLTNQATWSGCFRPSSHCEVYEAEVKVSTGPAFGLKLGWDFDRSSAIEVTITTAAAERQTIVGTESEPTGPFSPYPAALSVRNTFASLSYRHTWHLSARTALAAGIGASFIFLAGEAAWDDLRKQNAFGPVGILALTTGAGPVRLAVGISGTMYAIKYTTPVEGVGASVMQHDLMLTAGLQIGGWK